MNLYVAVGVLLIAIWIASIYLINEIKRVVQINARITQEGAEEISKQLREANQLLKEIRDIEFEVEDGKIRNIRNIPIKGWSHSYVENPLAELTKSEEKIKKTQL